MTALKNVELQDKLGNIIFRSNKLTRGAKMAGFVKDYSPVGTALTIMYGLYKD